MCRYLSDEAEAEDLRAPGDICRPSARAARPRGRDPQRRQGPRQGERAARQLRAGRRHRRQGHDPRRGNRRAPDGGRARPLRARRPRASDLGARRQGGLARPEAAGQDHPHARLAPPQACQVPRVRGLVALSDGRGHDLARIRDRARLPRPRAVGARPPAGVQDAPVHPQDARGRRAGRLGREDDHERRLARDADEPRRPGPVARRRERRSRRPGALERRPLRDRVGSSSGGGGVGVRFRGERTRAGSVCSTATTTRCGTATSARACARFGTCGRRSRRASSSAAASRAQ